MRSKLCICSILLLTGLGIGRASAQVCSGEFSFAGSPARLIFGLGFNYSAQTYHGGLRVGGERVFGEAEFGMATYDVGGDAWDYGAGFGLQLGGGGRGGGGGGGGGGGRGGGGGGGGGPSRRTQGPALPGDLRRPLQRAAEHRWYRHRLQREALRDRRRCGVCPHSQESDRPRTDGEFCDCERLVHAQGPDRRRFHRF